MASFSSIITAKKESDTLYGVVTQRLSSAVSMVNAGGVLRSVRTGGLQVSVNDAVIIQRACGVWQMTQKLGQAEKIPETVYI